MTMAKTRINVDSFACTRSDVLNYVNKSPLPCVWRATSFLSRFTPGLRSPGAEAALVPFVGFVLELDINVLPH